ncbi:MAG: LysR family transcriptional regulator, partial [Oscillospiraceae bacterium]|nr:LysR family transcriptional regulator [Oscillospiraceae bacterium]
MTIQQLQYLQEVYRAGSILQAAKNLYVAQSSISSSISAL